MVGVAYRTCAAAAAVVRVAVMEVVAVLEKGRRSMRLAVLVMATPAAPQVV
jgi:hypothetical protein